MDCWKYSLWYNIVLSQLLYIRLHECCKQLKRPVAVIPQSSYPETHSQETAGMSSFSLSPFFTSNFLTVGFPLFFCMSFPLSFCPVLGMCKQSPTALSLFSPFPFYPCTLCGGSEQTPALCTQTWQSVTDTEANANNGSNACRKMRAQRGVVRHPPLFAPSHTH